MLRISEQKYISDYLTKYSCDLKRTWDLVNGIINKKKKYSKLPNIINATSGCVIDDSKAIADYFNEYFTNIGPTLGNKMKCIGLNPIDNMGAKTPASMFLTPVHNNELLDAFNQLKNTSAGYDDIKPIVLQSLKVELLHPVLHLVNLSFKQGIFPDSLKIACISPIHKQGQVNFVENYRPVSVLCSLSKIFERIMCNRLLNFIDSFNILYKNQYGFRKGYSTDLALLKLNDDILRALDEKKKVVGVYMDLAKAFDTINHEILIQKLDHYGVRGRALSWFKSYLSNRYQMVKYHNVLSEKSKIICGVPQGSIIGPVLFLLYINDIHRVSEKLSFVMFADDTNIFIKGCDLNNIISILNSELKNISTWFQANQLSLNVSKTHYMIFSNCRAKAHSTVNIDGHELEMVSCTKFLGVKIDDKLTWKEHISYVKHKLMKSLGILYKIRNVLTRKWRIKLYKTFVLPHLNYCNIVWASTYQSSLKDLFIVQKKALNWL